MKTSRKKRPLNTQSASVHVRVDAQLRARAVAVLQARGLALSEVVRLFLCQLVRERGLPVTVPEPQPRAVSGKYLWAVKRKEQRRQRKLSASGNVRSAHPLLIRPNRLKGARIEWPDAPLCDD